MPLFNIFAICKQAAVVNFFTATPKEYQLLQYVVMGFLLPHFTANNLISASHSERSEIRMQCSYIPSNCSTTRAVMDKTA